jgi:hypothetical protein
MSVMVGECHSGVVKGDIETSEGCNGLGNHCFDLVVIGTGS